MVLVLGLEQSSGLEINKWGKELSKGELATEFVMSFGKLWELKPNWKCTGVRGEADD